MNRSLEYVNVLRTLARPIRAADLPRSLDGMTRLLAALSNPQTRFRAVVAAGSTGKGTATYGLAALFQAAGRRTGRYTSPHLHSFRERFAIDGAPITQQAFVPLAQEVLRAAASIGIPPSTFEAATALACLWFAEQHVEIAVMEIGLGGRFDAVNAVPHEAAIITPIENEHAAMLGGTLESIAWHKAGVISPGGVAVSAPQIEVARRMLRQEAEAVGASLVFAAREEELIETAYREIAPRFSLSERPPDIPLPSPAGRMEIVHRHGRAILIDGGHTAHSAQRLRARLDMLRGDERVTVIAGMLHDKDPAAYLAAFDHPAFDLWLTTAPSDRGLAAHVLAERAALSHARVWIIPVLDEAFKRMDDLDSGVIVICGSLRVAAAAREWLGLLTREALDEARATREIFEGEDYLRKLSS